MGMLSFDSFHQSEAVEKIPSKSSAFTSTVYWVKQMNQISSVYVHDGLIIAFFFNRLSLSGTRGFRVLFYDRHTCVHVTITITEIIFGYMPLIQI